MAAAIQTQSPAPQRVGNNPQFEEQSLRPLLFLACCGFPQSPPHPYPSPSSLPCLTHPSIRRGAVFVVFKLLLVSLFLSSSQFVSAISVLVFFATEIQPHIDSPFFSSSLRDAGYNSDCEAFGAGRRYGVG
jgi:hypothetical protein